MGKSWRQTNEKSIVFTGNFFDYGRCLHVMCLGKQIDFAVATEIPLTLTFENAGEMEITAVIRDN